MQIQHLVIDGLEVALPKDFQRIPGNFVLVNFIAGGKLQLFADHCPIDPAEV